MTPHQAICATGYRFRYDRRVVAPTPRRLATRGEFRTMAVIACATGFRKGWMQSRPDIDASDAEWDHFEAILYLADEAHDIGLKAIASYGRDFTVSRVDEFDRMAQKFQAEVGKGGFMDSVFLNLVIALLEDDSRLMTRRIETKKLVDELLEVLHAIYGMIDTENDDLESMDEANKAAARFRVELGRL